LSFYLNKTPTIIRPLAKDLIWSLPTETPSLFLTFDDGPIPEVTIKVCEILEEFNAKASFFCVGENVKKYPEVFQHLIAKGHSYGNHTFNHINGWKSSNAYYYRNIIEARKYIASPLFRPPYGQISRSQSKALSKTYKIIMWDVLSGDFDPKVDWQKCVNNVINNAGDGSIIVFHDSLKSAETMLKALPIILRHFSDLNYSFKAIPMSKELLNRNRLS
jgi:peptidoglycan/xylan/chitin deacetylase (PgdA/CDA1 family)